MTVAQLLYFLRWGVALPLLCFGGFLLYVAIAILLEGIPNPKGSMGDAVLLLVLAGALASAPLFLAGGGALAFRLIGQGIPRRVPGPLRPLPAARGEAWVKASNGARLGVLFNGGRAVLLWDAGNGECAVARGAAAASETLLHPFVDGKRRLLQLPWTMTVPEVIACSEQARVAATGARSDALDWAAMTIAPDLADDLWGALVTDRLETGRGRPG